MDIKEISKFDSTTNNFINNIDSLRGSLPILLNQLKIAKEDSIRDYDKFLKEKGEYLKESNKYNISPSVYWKFKPLENKMKNAQAAIILINRSFIISLVSQLDGLIRDLMQIVIEITPAIITNSERQLTFSEINQFEDIEAAKIYLIEKEIESVIRDNIEQQFSWFEKKLNIQLRKDLPAYKTLIELTQRRNMFVHNDGKVSSQYLKICLSEGINHDGIKVNDILNSDEEYFELAYNCLFEIGFKLSQVLRRKLNPDSLENADRSFVNTTFELVLNEQYKLASQFFEFAKKYIKFTQKDFELRTLLNQAQTYKWMGLETECKALIDSIDLTASNELFKMACYILLDKFDKAASSMKIVGNQPAMINKEHYYDWPIFKEFRKTEFFKEAYEEIFGSEEPMTIEGNLS